jgi:uncharacterized protein involved in exopolysaccharide biosynthesis
MKSRKIVQKALLNSFTKDNESKSLADVLLEMKDIKQNLIKKGIWRGESLFQVNGDPTQFNLQQDSIIGILFEIIAEPNSILSVSQRDKKVSIISVEVNSENERFSKLFSESIVKEVSDFYIETKSKKAKNNVAILQHQADSIRNELNIAIMGVAVTADNTFNLNPALNVNRIPSTKKQIDVQANTAILTQLVTNLEMAKVTLLRETPLIQIIDRPTLPLKKDEPGKAKFLLLGGLLFGFLSILYLIIKRILMQLDQ